MAADLIIKNGRIVLEHQEFIGDIGIKNGKIISLGENLEGNSKIIDATGLLVAPGMVDAHVHLSEPGRSHWEGYETGTKAAIKGGVTTIIEMPLNQLPATVNGEAMAIKRQAGAGKLYSDVALLGGLIPGNEKGIEELNKAGAVGYKAFMATCGDPTEPLDFRHVNDHELLQGMSAVAKTGKALGVHAENAAICDGLGKKFQEEGKCSAKDYTASRPSYSEVEAIRRLLYLGKIAGCPLHICHISGVEGLIEITEARQRGQNITTETCPHYLLLDTTDVERIGTLAKCSPPIRDKENGKALWEKVLQGEIDVIGSDHSPCPPSMKEGDFFEAWGGIAGLQSTVELLIHEAVLQREMPVWKLFQMLSANPARIFGLTQKGSIAIGKDADILLMDLKDSYTLKAEDLEYRHKISPYIGRKIHSRILSTFLRGEEVYRYQKGFIKTGKFL